MNWQEFIIKILDLILRWPFVMLFFIAFFKKEISNIFHGLSDSLKRISKIVKGDLIIESQYNRQIEERENEKIQPEEITRIIEEYEKNKKEKDEFATLAAYWFLSFLNSFLVYNSKLALSLFRKMPMSKEFFKKIFQLPPEIKDHDLEKEAIINALLTYKLIEPKEDGLYHITKLGEDFLKFIGWIK
jgi:hypothetical protein